VECIAENIAWSVRKAHFALVISVKVKQLKFVFPFLLHSNRPYESSRGHLLGY
jgi:hypothetical protein